MNENVWMRQLPATELSWLQPMFQRVFQHPVSAELLRWKYASSTGESWAAGLEGNAQPVLHCGLLFRDILFFGYPKRAAQLVDLMAEPKRQGLSRKQSPFTLLMRHLLAQLPSREGPEAIAFGFPSDRAMRLGEHNGVYCAVDRWERLEFSVHHRSSGPRLRPWQADNPQDQALLETFWERMRKNFSAAVIGVRDSGYLNWRYLSHPEKKYDFFVAESRWRKQPIGLVVLAPGVGHREIVDIIGDWTDFPEILLAIQKDSKQHSASSLSLMLTSSFARSLSPFADDCHSTEFRIMANPTSPPDILEKLRGRWWLTGGDTDYR